MGQAYDFAALPEADRLAYFGALFAMASADGVVDKDELAVIFDVLDLDGFSSEARTTLQSYLLTPPALDTCLEALAQADDLVRFGLMVNMVDVAYADDILQPEEQAALARTQTRLRITDAQVKAIVAFLENAKQLQARGVEDGDAQDARLTAAAGLAAVGVPVTAAYVTSAVSGAGAATTFAALGLGLGVLPGIGVAALMGAGVFYGVSYALDTGGRRKRSAERATKELKAQTVLQHLNTSIADLTKQLLQHGGDSEDEMRQLTDRLTALQQLAIKRQRQTGGSFQR